MAFQNANNIDARHAIINDVGGNQYIQYGLDEINLKKLEPAKMDPSRRTPCLKDTRVDVLDFIIDWASDPACSQKILWLYGLAGSGKSTISTTIANHFRISGQLGAFLFFDRNVKEQSDPALVIRTLAYQIGSFHPWARKLMSAVIENSPAILLSPIAFQFQRLLVELLPCGESLPAHPQLVLVLDALDECGTAKDRAALVEVLAEHSVLLPPTFKMIITSRADFDIRYALGSQQHVFTLELDLISTVTSHDISTYFRHHSKLIHSKKRYLRGDWPGDDKIRALTDRACGLFVWASTAVQFIDAHDPRKRLEVILQGSASSGAESTLDTLYQTALESVRMWDDEDFVADFQAIMGMVLVLRNPLSSTAIDSLLGTPDTTDVDNLLGNPSRRPSSDTISQLGCVVSLTPTIRVIHPSFSDFLLTRSRCGRDKWFFQKDPHNYSLAVHCLHCLNRVLRRNICNLTLSVSLKDETLPEDVTYACLFWMDHICAITENLSPLMEPLSTFLHRHLLHWFEAMSILKRSRDTIKMLNNLVGWFMINFPQRHNILELVRDASRFAQTFAKSIEDHPLLVYFGALPFAPTNSEIYKRFHNSHSCPSISGGFQQSWSPLQLVLAEHEGAINSVAFSPDGTRIISGSDDKTVRVWDATSGAEVLPALRGHDDWVRSVAFSHDGTRIASGSNDKTVRVWDAVSGAQVLPALQGHRGHVWSVAFCPDGNRIISGSGDKTIRVWDVVSGAEVFSAMRGHGDRVSSVAFSPNGSQIVSGSDDHSLRVWNAVTGTEALPALRGHEHWVRSVAFSPDGTRIVSGSTDQTVRVWDAKSGVELKVLQGHEYWVLSVAFSPDGTRIVSGSADKTIRFWDASSGTETLPVLRGHEHWVLSASFSSDGTRIVSASIDKTIRVWGTDSGASALPSFRGHKDWVRSVAFSPDGTKIVSGSDDHTIRVWDVASGLEVIPALRGHEDWVWSVVFSSNGTQIVSGSYDNDIRAWDAKTGIQLSPTPTADHDHVLDVFDHVTTSAINVTTDGRLVHVPTNRTISKLPAMIDTQCSAWCEKFLAVGTRGGRIFIMHFPPYVLLSSETRPFDAQGS